ncbi:MAG: acyl-CoA dehydrogenase family protein [Nannocystaceae bacterium]
MFALTDAQRAARDRARDFVDAEVVPHADRFDREERIDDALLRKVAAAGYFGASLPATWGGTQADPITYGLLFEELGRACSSLRCVLTVHTMVAATIARWGRPAARERWLRRLAAGEAIAAFALTEPEVGSDAAAVTTAATPAPGGLVVRGTKRWITSAQIADVFLVIARLGDAPVALLVDRHQPGVVVRPITGLLGCRGSLVAEVALEDAHVPEDGVLARPGFGVSHVATHALDDGRYTVAWGCVGLLRACVEASTAYAGERRQFGALLREQPLVQRLLTDMLVQLKAARALCLGAGAARERRDPGALHETMIAKYFASVAAARAAADAVQIHGARGCGPDAPVQRYLRDSKIMEIIEGSTQIQQMMIAASAPRDAARCP